MDSTKKGLGGYSQTGIGYLASALENIQNDDFYPSFCDKLAHLMFSCIKFHPFNDGNKRTSIYLGMCFLDIICKHFRGCGSSGCRGDNR
ncbi:Fic family protein [Helicobacter suis]|uniref:Fic family protein n=1 Tax=Helicobacter suis TaxID=104628 RepID=UPI000AF59D0F|nr:Fic family protein [Helicobacter suis]